LELENIINRFDGKIETYVQFTDSYRKFVVDLLDEYLSEVMSASNLYGTLEAYYINEHDFKADLQKIVLGLTKTINHYFQKSSIDGKALALLKEVINDTKLFSSHSIPIRTNQLFFRLRPVKEEDSQRIFSRKELFHIPFEDRGFASTNRYSLTGYPCLYLANSTFVAWEEMRKNSKKYACSLFVNQIPLRFVELDATPFNYRTYDNDNSKYDDLIDYALLFPIVAACSLKVREHQDNHKFKSEYVIPQLLLESLRGEFYGIRYRSTRIPDFTEQCWNFAIPPKDIMDSGYCITLKRMFSMSEVNVFDFADPLNVKTDSDRFENQDVYSVLIDENRVDFKDTIFAEIEHELNQTHKTIDF
jgi:RES domain